MDKQKQIEEMEKTLYDYRFHCDDCIEGSESNLAKFLVNLGWIKPAENAVVLTKERYEKLLDARADVILKDIDKVFKEEFEDTKRSMKRKIKPVYKAIETRIRKETAEKFAERLKSDVLEDNELHEALNAYLRRDYFEYIDEVCKEFTEGKI